MSTLSTPCIFSMDSLSVFLFASAGISLGVGAFYLMFSAAMSKEVRDYNAGKTPSPRVVHPEMEDVEVGDELLIVKFDDEPQDPLLQSLENRITELNDRDDDDDDGDVVVRI